MTAVDYADLARDCPRAAAVLAIARELGVKRVVLERQMTLEEIAAVRKQTDLEVEVLNAPFEKWSVPLNLQPAAKRGL